MRRALSSALLLSAFVSGCPTEEPPPVASVPIGTIVGKVLVEGEAIGGATVEVYGTPTRETTEEGKQFVLGAVPVGQHTIIIQHEELNRSARFQATVSQPFQTVYLDEEDTALGRAATLRGVVQAGDSGIGAKVYLVGGNGKQQADAGDSGEYELTGLPRGTVEIGFSKQGHETKIIELDLAEGDNDADDVALAASSVGDLCFSSTVKLVDRSSHEGVAVLLNGGEQVVPTDAAGLYRFCDLGPGLYSIKAQAPGFKSMTLASIALDAAGEVHGLVPAFLSPGSDEEDGAADRVLEVVIDSPGANAQFEEGFTVSFVGRGQDRGAPFTAEQLEWFRAPQADPTTMTSMGTGNVLNVPDMPTGTWIVSLVGTALDGAQSAPVSVVIEVVPFQAAARGLFVEIQSPLSNTTFEAGATISFIAAGEDRGSPLPEPGGYEWSYLPQGDPSVTPTPLGTGPLLTVDALPVGDWIVSVEGVALDGARTQPVPVVVKVIPFNYSLAASIIEPANGLVFTEGTEIKFRCEASTTRVDFPFDPAQDVSWGFRPVDDQSAALSPLLDVVSDNNRGLRVTSRLLPVGEWTVVATVSVDGGAGVLAKEVDISIVPLQPTFTPNVVVIDVAAPVQVIETGLNEFRLDIYRGQVADMRISIEHPSEGELAVNATWASDTGIAFVGPVADFRTLPVGTHVFTVSAQDSLGEVTSATLTVDVEDFQFSLSIESPRLEGENPTGADPPPYFSEFGLPLRAGAIVHPYQQAFQSGQVKWFLVDTDTGTVEHIASGLSTRTFLAPAGQGVVRLEVTDNAGNVATTTAEYVLQDIAFSVFMVQPLDKSSILEGESITSAITWDHSLLAPDPQNPAPGQIVPADLQVRYFSSINGLLSDTLGRSLFGVDDQPVFDELTFGTHKITVSVSDGQGRIASDSRQVLVRSPGVNGTLVSPRADGLVLLPGVSDVTFDVSVTKDAAVTPKLRWRFDGVEIPASWDDYGTDELNPGRASIALGTYDPVAAPFNGGLFTPGTHSVEFFARLPDVDTQFGGDCVNIPQRAVCITFNVFVPAGETDVCNGVTFRDITGVETWSDVRRLNCDIDVEASGRLVIAPGTRIIVEEGKSWDIDVLGGELVIGADNAAEVVFETQAATSVADQWVGIDINASSTVTITNATFRNASQAIAGNSTYGTSTTTLRNVTVETSRHGIYGFCPAVLEGFTARNLTDWAIYEGNKYGCGSVRRYDGVLIEDSVQGIDIAGDGDVVVTNSVFRNLAWRGLHTDDGTLAKLEVRDSLFDNIGGNDGDAAVEINFSCRRVHVYDSELSNNSVGIYYNSTCAFTRDPLDRIVVNRSRFSNNGRAISDEAQTDLPLRVHASIFDGNATHFYLHNNGQDLDAQGNWIGAATDTTEPGGVLFNTPPGVSPNLPRVRDYRDVASVGRVARVDNPLRTKPASIAGLPHVIVRHPEQTGRYNTALDDGCLPLVVESLDLADVAVLQPAQPLEDNLPDANVPTDPDAACAFYLIDDPAAPDDPTREHMGYDSDGCYVDGNTLTDGEYALALECALKDSGRIDTHVVRFRIDNTAVQGRLWRTNTTFDGAVEVSGDIVVPAGSTLTIAPGAVVSVRGGDNLRYARYPNAGTGNDVNANSDFGSRILPDFFVDGALIVGAAGGARATVKGTGSVPARGSWGGIRVWQNGNAVIENADVSGADAVLHGYYNAELATAPLTSLTDASLTEVTTVFRGVCPVAFSEVDVEGARWIAQPAYCTGSFEMSDSTFTSVGARDEDTALIRLDSYAETGANLQALFTSVTIDKAFGTRRGDLIAVDDSNFGTVVISGGVFKDFRHLVQLDVWASGFTFQIDVNNSVADNFVHVVSQFSSADRYNSVSLDRNVFTNANRVVYQYANGTSTTLTNNRLEDLTYVFEDLRLGSGVTDLTFSGNHVENVAVVFGGYALGSGGQTHTPVLTSNNLVNVSSKLVTLNPNNLGTQSVETDLTGNYFGTTDTTAIEALINDPQADGGADMVGLTDYSGYLSAPLVLPDVPPLP